MHRAAAALPPRRHAGRSVVHRVVERPVVVEHAVRRAVPVVHDSQHQDQQRAAFGVTDGPVMRLALARGSPCCTEHGRRGRGRVVRRAVARRERRRSARRGRAGQEKVVAGGPAARALARKTAHARARGGDSVAPADGACGQQASGGTTERSVRERGQAWRSTSSASGGGRGAR